MPIRFACPSCGREYSVKDELAGKGAKCGQCGHKMKIPQAATAVAAASSAAAPPSSRPQPIAPKSAGAKPVAAKSAAVPRTVAKTAKNTTAKQPAAEVAPHAAKAEPAAASWLDEELESAHATSKAKPPAPPPEASCPSCNGPLLPGAIVCTQCGYDTRIRGKRSVERGSDDSASEKPSRIGFAGSLVRGTVLSFLAAMLGAVIWAALAYFTMYEFSIVAWGLGGLAGLGMAVGHDDDDGTFAGIIAAFMSLVGIVAAKVFIVVILIAAAVSTIVQEAQNAPHGDPIEMQRYALSMALAMKDLEASGDSLATVDERRWEAALAKSQEEVAELTPEEVEARFNELGEEHGLEGDVEGFDHDEAVAADETAEAADEAAGPEENAGIGSLVGMLFGPMDALFILLAFFTAYKVGSGQATD